MGHAGTMLIRIGGGGGESDSGTAGDGEVKLPDTGSVDHPPPVVGLTVVPATMMTAVSAQAAAAAPAAASVDPVKLSIFTHRFMSIAEQMGRTLQRTAVSTNIKERLDFSCALFGPTGALVSNAPSIPVHLGAMSEAVRWQLRLNDGGKALNDGDVLVTNHPAYGGSHLPDITVITPVFGGAGETKRIIFFVASRGHHADIGGITPGSMPPFSQSLYQEGAILTSTKLVTGGKFHTEEISRQLTEFPDQFPDEFYAEFADKSKEDGDGSSGLVMSSEFLVCFFFVFVLFCFCFLFFLFPFPHFLLPILKIRTSTPTICSSTGRGAAAGVSGTRRLADNLSDLRAQVAANARGVALVAGLVAETPGGIDGVVRYMGWVEEAAEGAVREALRGVAHRVRATAARAAAAAGAAAPPAGDDQLVVVRADDAMDDGTQISVEIRIDPVKGSAVFDFSGTGLMVRGNTNAPVAVTRSAVIYCLRSIVDRDVPLNEGCLNPVEIVIPEGSILAPATDAAVVGGNVLTSMRVTDVILAALGACAGSQGCLNNVTFGTETSGYYETIAGGAGAGPTWHGQSAVHSHMSNTRITDAEILERRYPVVLRRFAIRKGSGGAGKFRGGEGVVREVEC
jgi:N-methylhydantoinase B/oxoprolinase/acetone carboxylase alpha subunit